MDKFRLNIKKNAHKVNSKTTSKTGKPATQITTSLKTQKPTAKKVASKKQFITTNNSKKTNQTNKHSNTPRPISIRWGQNKISDLKQKTIKRQTAYHDIPFYSRADLSLNEKEAIKHYRDLTFPQYNWHYQLNSNRKQADCDMINKCLRGMINTSKLTKDEKIFLKSLRKNLDTAISKSHIDKATYVYRGINWYHGFDNEYSYLNVVTDKAYNSSSISKSKAMGYASISPNGYKIIIAIILLPGDNALYIDNVEKEYLLPRNNKYKVFKIETKNKTKYYYLEKIK